MQFDNDQRLVDELTPTFAGIIDRHTWAGRSGAWIPDQGVAPYRGRG